MFRSPKKIITIGDDNDGDEYGLVPSKSLKRRDLMLNSLTSSADSCHSSSSGTVPTIISDDNQSADHSSIQFDFQQHQQLQQQHPSLKRTPDEVAQLLQEVDALLARRYRSIKLNDSPYIQDFKEATLRAEGYVPQKAVDRIETHWKKKIELFGMTLSEKKICLHDMILPSPYMNPSSSTTPEEEVSCGHMQDLIESGVIQLLPTRDLAGRAVLCFKYDPALFRQDHQHVEILKYMYYMLSTAMEDEETQNRGISLIVLNITTSSQSNGMPWGNLFGSTAAGGLLDPFWAIWREIRKLYSISRLHYCMISSDHSTTPYSSRISEEYAKTQIRIHQGSLQECFHGLMTLGIPSHVLPIEHDGQLATQRHLDWIDFRKRTDSMLQQRTRRIVLIPGRNDVLFGRRKYSSPANILFHGLISTNLVEYMQANDTDKKALRKEIRNCIVRPPRDGRFLQQLDDQSFLWEEMEETVALYKVGQAFEFLAKKLRLNRNGVGKHSSEDSDGMNSMVRFGTFMVPKQCWNILHCEGQDECVAGWSLSSK